MTPFFSVVIPVYNRAGTVAAAIESALNQEFTDRQIIVIDDGSTDGTADVVESRFAGAIEVIRQKNAGPGAARNAGIHRAKGEYVAFLDSDDLWFPWTLSCFDRAIRQYGQPDFLCGLPIEIQPGDPIKADGDQAMTVEQHADFYSVPGNPFFRFTTSGVAVRKSSLEKAGGFAGDRINYEDLDLWMRLGTARGFVVITNPPLVVRRFLGDNISASRLHNIRGASFMIASEKSGQYPGGSARRHDRRRLLTVLMRAASVQMARSRDLRAALSVYRQIFLWSALQLRFRYLLGLPMQMVTAMMGKR